MFLAGLELDLPRVRGRSLELAGTGWMISLALAVLIASALTVIGTVLDAVVIGLALTTTALGTLLPILRDADLFEGRFGARVMAIGSVGEFGPILAVNAAALVAAGMLSVLLYPMIARILLRRASRAEPAQGYPALTDTADSSVMLLR
jgi:Kef-type K+ transport system membrane component KefB